jgi:hypothetical protein
LCRSSVEVVVAALITRVQWERGRGRWAFRTPGWLSMQ